MPFESKLNLTKALNRLTKELKIRIVVVRGWGLTDESTLNDNPNIKFIQSAPYDKLLPRVRAVVHHGGIGTIAECLKAGKPFLSCPVLYPLGDQHFWGIIAYKHGLALKPVPLRNMTENLMVELVKTLFENEQLYLNCERMKQSLKNENGVARAIEIIEQFRPAQVI